MCQCGRRIGRRQLNKRVCAWLHGCITLILTLTLTPTLTLQTIMVAAVSKQRRSCRTDEVLRIDCENAQSLPCSHRVPSPPAWLNPAEVTPYLLARLHGSDETGKADQAFLPSCKHCFLTCIL